MEVIAVSSKTGDGMDHWLERLLRGNSVTAQ
jgi:hypothetical protein